MDDKMVGIDTKPTKIEELYQQKGKLQRQMCEIDEQIRTMIEDEYKGKLKTALEILGEIYDAIPSAKNGYIETYCDRCEETVTIDLDDALDKIEYAFNKLIKWECAK